MREIDYKNIQTNRDINLFKWKSSSIKLPRDPEFWLSTGGLLGYGIKDGKWYRGSFTGILDEYGDFETFVALPLKTTNEGAKDLKNHKDIIVCRNTPLCLPNEAQNNWFSKLHSETDKSILCMILLTRLSKILECADDPQKKQIEEAFKNVKEGMPIIFASSILQDLKVNDLTDAKFVDKIQYLNGLMGEIDKREANYKGIDLELLDKRAQVTSNELKQYDDITTLDYMVRYVERLRFVEEMKENGFDIEIVRNPIFFDEPTPEDIDDGNFEIKEEETAPEETNPEETEDKKDEENPETDN